MIKRRPNLSIEEGGTVSRQGKNGHVLRLGSYCRLFQTRPSHSRNMLCTGFLNYPACPDLAQCCSKPLKVRKVVEIVPFESLEPAGIE